MWNDLFTGSCKWVTTVGLIKYSIIQKLNSYLIQRALLGLLKQSLVHVSVVSTQRRSQHHVGNVERVHDADRVRTDRRQRILQLLLQPRHVTLGQGGELETRMSSLALAFS